MEIIMNNRTITHEVKLEKSVKIIIGIFAIGVFLNVFSPLLETKSALAELYGGDKIKVEMEYRCRYGCPWWLYLGSKEVSSLLVKNVAQVVPVLVPLYK